MRLKKCEQNRLNHHEALDTSDLGVGVIKNRAGISANQQAFRMFQITLCSLKNYCLEKHKGCVDILIAILKFVENLLISH